MRKQRRGGLHCSFYEFKGNKERSRPGTLLQDRSFRVRGSLKGRVYVCATGPSSENRKAEGVRGRKEGPSFVLRVFESLVVPVFGVRHLLSRPSLRELSAVKKPTGTVGT